MPRLNLSSETCEIIAEMAQHKDHTAIIERFGCHTTTIDRIILRKEETGSAGSPPRSGRRPLILTPRDKNRITRFIKANRFDPPAKLLPQLQSMGFNFGLTKFRQVLAELGFKRRVAKQKPFLTKKAHKERLIYARLLKDDSVFDWQRTICVDEAFFCLNGTTKVYVTRQDGEEYSEDCLRPKMLSSSGGFMGWGGVWYGGRTPLYRFDQSESEGKKGGVTAIIYRDQITKGVLKEAWEKVNGQWRGYGGARILEDNARVHTCATNRSVGERQRFVYLAHPPSSPDLNPIENCWAWIKQRLAELPRHPTSIDALFEVCSRLWMEIPQEHIDACIVSMPRRLEEVRKAGGFVTKY